MSDQWADEGVAGPSPADASTALADLEPVQRRSRQLIRDTGMGRPLLAWGLTWMVGAVALHALPGWRGSAIGTAMCAMAAMVSWFGGDRQLLRGFERQFAVAWVVLLVSSPLLVIVVDPPTTAVLVVFLCCLWAMGMVLYGVATDDRPIAAVGASILVLSAACRLFVPSAALLVVGSVAGFALATLGAWRLWSVR